MNKLKSLLIAFTAITMMSGAAFAQGTPENVSEEAIAAKIETLMNVGSTLEEAAEAVSEDMAVAIQNDPSLAQNLYAAVAIVAENKGISDTSPDFANAIGATSAVMMNKANLTEGDITTAAADANINQGIVVSTLPATAAGGGVTPNLGQATTPAAASFGIATAGSASSGGGAGSPSN